MSVYVFVCVCVFCVRACVCVKTGMQCSELFCLAFFFDPPQISGHIPNILKTFSVEPSLT